VERNRVRPIVDRRFDTYLTMFRAKLAEFAQSQNTTADDVQTLCFSIARDNALVVSEWFKYSTRYFSLRTVGQRWELFIRLYGVEATVKKIDEYFNRRQDDDNRAIGDYLAGLGLPDTRFRVTVEPCLSVALCGRVWRSFGFCYISSSKFAKQLVEDTRQVH